MSLFCGSVKLLISAQSLSLVCLMMSAEEMEKALGFSGFTSNKHAKKFDFMEVFKESHSIAKQRNEEGNRKLDGVYFVSILTIF